MQATVLLASILLFTKSRVGGALLSIEENGTHECGAVALQFGAGTWPDRLKGFNRFGATQEIVRFDHGQLTESSYYGIMTAAREANLSQAEQAFRSSTPSITLSVGYGASTAAGCEAKVEHKAVPSTYSWPDCPRLMGELRGRRLANTTGTAGPMQRSVLPTFLYAVRNAILSGQTHTSTRYTHNGEIYSLTTERRPSNQSGEHVFTGRILDEKSHRESEFRVWLDSAAQLPLRIEFRAKNYLKLTLEADDHETLPVFERILDETES